MLEPTPAVGERIPGAGGKVEEQTEPPAAPSPPSPEPEETVTTVRFAAVGDVLIHSSLYKDAKTEDGYQFGPMFELVKPFISRADFAMANQESMIGGEAIGLSDYPQFNSPFEIGTTLKEVGFEAVTIANNHTLDRGPQAILNAIGHWDSIGMIYTGAYRSKEDRETLRIVEKNGISMALLGYTYGTNGIPVPEGMDYLVSLIDPEQIVSDIEKASRLADVTVLQLHFGTEYERMPNKQQKELAHQLAEAGADLIIGHHSHVLQPCEWIEREDGQRTFVIYSLGNFLSGQEGVYKEIGGILGLTIEKRVQGEQRTVTLLEPALLPTWTHKKNWRNYKILPLDQVTEQQLPGVAGYRQEIADHMTRWMPELKIISSGEVGGS
ncbi:hypothetical protein J2TS4_06930 [Paenibacillus sp. J2TS4]|nr:hypothetical protein J2TS4_06930 [Paenibacillus sp. J2TS4]